jgi:hypothetical protein
MQTWLMVAVAVGMLAIILMAGRREPPARTASMPATTTPAPNTDRVRDYQDRRRVLETRAIQEARADAMMQPTAPAVNNEGPPPVRSEDPLVSERKRRDYESLFASNVVLSRRPQGQRPDLGQAANAAPARPAGEASLPSIDEIADAAVRATARVGTLAEQFETNARSAWGYVQGLTRLSQRTPWQDGRFALDRAASRLLTTVH